MPVTVRLSREFYEKFGDQVVGELVELLNQVDATYRSELREINEVNFARFDEKLERRLSDLDAKWERRFTDLDAKWERRLTDLEAKWEIRLTDLDARWVARIGDLRAELIKWMFLFWLGTVASVLGIGRAVLR